MKSGSVVRPAGTVYFWPNASIAEPRPSGRSRGGAAVYRREAKDRARPKAEVGGCGKQTFELRGVNYFLD